MRNIHLFAGGGGGLLADRINGHTPVVAVEWESHACRVLRERAEEGWFPGLHVHEGDVRLFHPSKYPGRVDGIHAGFPCQDISCAGNQAGVGEGTRSGLYLEVIRIADEVREINGELPYLWLENVAAIVTGGAGEMLRTVTADLASRGFDAVWLCLSASEVGAPHKRDRWWLLAYPGSERCREAWPDCERPEKRTTGSGDALADANIHSTQGMVKEPQQIEHGRPAGLHHREGGEQSVGYWEIEPDVGRVAHGVASRVDRLKETGNGQVPLQAAAAFAILFEMMMAIEGEKYTEAING